ncbi:MAG: DUF4360 domain-containing protein [Methylotenera sp.]|nr:DUF4360 domain-containing protein [Oligoflexia bacterium]
MNRLITASLILASTVLASPVSALADDIALGVPGYGGNGCPQGTVSATLSPDNKQLSVLFDAYQAEAGGNTGRRLDRKSCQVAIPVHVPQGLSVSILQVDYRGFNSVPYGARSTFNVEYFFAGQRGPSYQKSFNGPINDQYLINNMLQASAIIWSPCGADLTLRSNSSMMAQTNSRNEQTLSTVDSMDISAGIVYQLQFRTCQ